MSDVDIKAAHEHVTGTSKEPVLPPEYDIQPGSEDEGEVIYRAKITLRSQIPPDGPEDSHMRTLIARVVLLMWVIWLFFGFVQLTLTKEYTMLLAAPILLLVPFRFVLKYYFNRPASERFQHHRASAKRSSHKRK